MSDRPAGTGERGRGANLWIQQVVALGAKLQLRASRLLNLGIAVHCKMGIE